MSTWFRPCFCKTGALRLRSGYKVGCTDILNRCTFSHNLYITLSLHHCMYVCACACAYMCKWCSFSVQVQSWSLSCWTDRTCQKLTTQWCMWVNTHCMVLGALYLQSDWKGDPLASSLQCLDDIVPELHEKHKLEVTIIAQVSECVCLSVFESTNSVYWDWACAVRLVCYWMWLPCVPPPPSPSILAWLCSLMLCVFWRRHSRGGSSPLSQHHWKMATKTGPQRIVLVRECMYVYHAPLCII